LDYLVKDSNIDYSIKEIHHLLEMLKKNKTKTILSIDDSKFVGKKIKNVLTARNLNVVNKYSGKDGLEYLEKNKVDLLILDMELPDLSGMEILKKIRNDRKFDFMPIIVLSAKKDAQSVRDVLKNGGNDYLQKPFIPEELVLKVDLWLNFAETEKKLYENKEKLSIEVKQKEKIIEQKDKELLYKSKLAQLGEMISLIAHQWKQPLNSLSTVNSLFKLKILTNTLNNDEALEINRNIEENINIMSETVDEFKDFFSPNKEKSLTTSKKIVDSVLKILEFNILKNDIQIIREYESNSRFSVYENEIKHVILNIIQNAIDALVENKIKKPSIKIKTVENKIIIEDNAGGIKAENLGDVFNNYFTTKEYGTGIGLYMSKKIMQKNGGNIEVENSRNGAKFTIILPTE